jgi:hypothetical protein
MWLASGGTASLTVATGYYMDWVPNSSRFEIRNYSNHNYMSYVSGPDTVGIYDTATSQWVHWSAAENNLSQDYGPINGVQVFRVYVTSSQQKWYINALP